MAKVFVVQEPLRKSPHTGQLITSFNLTPARIYGELEVLLEHRQIALTPGPMIHTLKRKLQHFSDDDYLLCVGDPSAIAAAAMVAAHMNRGTVTMLKWDKPTKSYIKTTITV